MIRKTKWKVIVMKGVKRKDYILSSKEGETAPQAYHRIKEEVEKLKVRLGNEHRIDLVSLTIPLKPKGDKPHKSWYWCPYCNAWRPFSYDDYIGVNKCPICGISDEDFYVKKYNNLWNKDFSDRKEKK